MITHYQEELESLETQAVNQEQILRERIQNPTLMVQIITHLNSVAEELLKKLIQVKNNKFLKLKRMKSGAPEEVITPTPQGGLKDIRPRSNTKIQRKKERRPYKKQKREDVWNPLQGSRTDRQKKVISTVFNRLGSNPNRNQSNNKECFIEI